MKPALIIGASSFGRLVSVLADEAGVAVAGFVDDFNSGESILGRTDDLGTRFKPDDFALIMGIGYKHMETRTKMFGDLVLAGFDFPTLRHPTARISPRATLGAGCLVMAGADIDSFTSIGDVCVIWPHATISHDNSIGANTFVSPGATLCGFVAIGDCSFIGANSTIVDSSSLPPYSFVKAGSRHNSRLNTP